MISALLLAAIFTCNQCHEEHAAAGNHPVGVVYDSARSNLKRPAPRELLVDGRVECTSCHVTHEEASAYSRRLRAESTTALCVSCHDVR